MTCSALVLRLAANQGWRYALLGIVMAVASTFSFADGPSVTAKPSSGSITLDGKLDEAIWRDAPVLRLVQQSPKPQAPTQFTTEVRIIIAEDRLYFGFICHDPEPQ